MKKWLVILGIIVFVGILGYLFWPSGEEVEVETIEDCLAKEGNVLLNTCLARVAEANKDETICELINYEGKGFQDACYIGVAVAKKDENICLLIKNNDLENKDQCYASVAIEKNDDSICNNIEEQSIRELCPERVKNLN